METPNITYIKELSDGDKSFEKELIKIIKLEFPKEKSIYFENFKSKKFGVTADCVHKLKHKISIFGLLEAYEIANNYENNLRNEDVNLNDKFEIILDKISNYLIQI